MIEKQWLSELFCQNVHYIPQYRVGDNIKIYKNSLQSNVISEGHGRRVYAVIEAWTSLGLNLGPPDYETNRMIVRDILLL